jgi:hypothetical protein
MATSTLGSGTLVLAGTTSGTTTVTATAVAGTTTLTLPAATDTLVGKATTDTLTNKTLTGAAMNGTLGATTPSTASVTTLTTSSTITHNGGTANGVAYLDGSKVLTTGSALVFDGTNLGVGVTPSASTLPTIQSEHGVLSGNSGINIIQNSFYNTNFKYTGTGLATRYYQGAGKHEWYTAASGTAGNAITFTQAMTLDASGNLGVGTTSPTDQVTLYGGKLRISNSTTGTSSGLVAGMNSNDAYISNQANGYLLFGTNNTERARIDSSGNLLVGTTSNAFSSRLAVQGTAGISTPDVTVGIPVNSSGNTCFTIARSAATNGYAQIETFLAGIGGAKLIINATNTGEVLVCGTTDNGAYNLQCNGTGVWGAGAYVNGSDERIKENIVPIVSGLDVIEKLNPVTYRYKDTWSKDQSTQTGFIAQELLVAMEGKNYVDGVVQQGGSEGYYSVAYQNIIPILTKAIQEQQALITQLTARITALESA